MRETEFSVLWPVKTSRGKSSGRHPLPVQFLQQMHNKTMFDLENERQCLGVYTNRNGSIRCQMSISINVILALIVFEIFTYQDSLP